MNNSMTQNTAAFDLAYKTLNKKQKLAVDTIEGPVMVVAGPGTGKTQVLTLRIANILLKTDTKPDSILALTFTESGAKAMRERLRKYIGSTAYRVPIFTFHGFAESLISNYPDSYKRVIGGRPANDIEKIHIIENILNGGEIKHLRPIGSPEYYVPHILRIIGQLKQEYVTPDSLVKIIDQQQAELSEMEKVHTKGAHKGKVKGDYAKKEKSIIKNQELLLVYRQYEAMLSANKLYDFEDMIVETVKSLSEDEEMLRDLQEQYQYILADEHQDVNGSQNKILELLASFHDSPNIFAVGDEKQAIYRFQGASLANFLYFKEKFVGTQVISLDENYRSGQAILDASFSLVRIEEAGYLKDLRIPLLSKIEEKAVVESRNFVHQAIEDKSLVDRINEEIEKGTPLSEVAVIVRTNREVETVSALIRKSGLRVTASADGDILRHPITAAVKGLIDSVVEIKNEEALFKVLHGAYWKITNNDLVRILSARSYGLSLWEILTSKSKLKELEVEDVAAVQKVTEVLLEARKREVYEAPHRVLEYLLQESGFVDHLITYDQLEGSRVLRRLYDEIEESVLRDGVATLGEVSRTFATLSSYNLKLNAPFIETNAEAVQVMTAHKSKGLEFTVVFVPYLTDKTWSGAGKKTYFDIPLFSQTDSSPVDYVEDERRLLYVAMTRAKSKLFISYSETNADAKELLVSRLLGDIEAGLIATVDTIQENDSFLPTDLLLQKLDPITIDKEILKHLLQERGFSATSLNNYLRSPWDYFYRNVLRIPETQALPMQFGTAIHNTLEQITREHTKTGNLPNDSLVKDKFEYELRKLPISNEEYSRLHEKGLLALFSYLGHLQKELPEQTKEEMKLRVHLSTGIKELPEVILTGKLDRIDLASDGTAVRVVDYKTGKPKSRNQIIGNTKNGDGGYYRQLVFYSLLLSLHDDERYRCNTGVLSFVEPDSKGNIKEEVFVISEDDIDSLRTEIIQSVKEIISGDFFSQPCDDKVSNYCHLVTALKNKT